MKYDVYGIESPLLDILVKVDDAFIKKTGYAQGGMYLVDETFRHKLLDGFNISELKSFPAGAVANTMMGIANLGGKAFYCGKTGKDKYGELYRQELEKEGVSHGLAKSGTPNGVCVSLITPDTERTMFTYLGASQELEPADVIVQEVSAAKIIYSTGYMIEAPTMKASLMKAIESKHPDAKVAFDLADAGLITRNKDFLKSFVEKYVDILFANEDEAKAFIGGVSRDAILELGKICEIVVVKFREKGAVVVEGNNLHEIDIFKVDAIDTTGAGDLFAAGFLYGFTRDMPLDRCGKIGAFMASRVVAQMGAKLDKSYKEELEKL